MGEFLKSGVVYKMAAQEVLQWDVFITEKGELKALAKFK
jgi:hypothetical protein